MKITLVDDWKDIAKRAYTMWLSYALVVLSMLVATAALVSDWAQKIIGPFTFAVAFFIAGCVLGFARLKKQPGSEGVV